jgi:hypothetical protein
MALKGFVKGQAGLFFGPDGLLSFVVKKVFSQVLVRFSTVFLATAKTEFSGGATITVKVSACSVIILGYM